MSTVFTITGSDWAWTEESEVPSPQINLKIFPASITSRANVPTPKVGPPITLAAWELRVYKASDGSLVAYVPRWRALTFQKLLNDVGTGKVELDLDDPMFLSIGDADLLEHENVWVVYWNGNRVFAFHNEDIDEILVQEDGTRTVGMSGRGIAKRLEYGTILPPNYPSWPTATTGRDWVWDNTQPMKAWRDLFTAATGRGAIAGITATFSNTVDSNSVAWNNPIDQMTQEPGETILTALSKMAELANADWRVNPDGTLDCAIAVVDGGGNYVSGLGDRLENLVRFQVGHDQVAFTRQRHRSEIRNAIYAEAGDGSDIGASSDSLSQTFWGRREHYVKAGDASGAAAVAAYALKVKDTMRAEQSQVNITVIPDHTDRVVFFDYDVGDWVGVTSDDSRLYGEQNGAYRVLGITTDVDDSGMSTVVLMCQTVLEYRLARMQKAIQGGGGAGSLITGGSNVGSGGSPGQDVATATVQAGVPTPTSLSFIGGANQNDIYVDIGWSAGFEPSGTRDPVQEYEVQVTPSANPTKRRVVRTKETNVRVTGLEPNLAYYATVVGITRLGRVSAVLGGLGTGGDFTSGHDTTAPVAAPTGLTVSPGISSVTLVWNEVSDTDVVNGNGTYAIEIDTVNTFNSGNWQSKRTSGTVTSFTNLTASNAGVTYYARVAAIDSSGNQGPWSGTASAATRQAGTADISVNSIVTNHMQAGTINGDRITADTLVGNQIIANTINGDRIQANTLDANVIKTSEIEATTSITVLGIIQADKLDIDAVHHNYWTADGNAFRFVKAGTSAFTGGTEQMRFDVATGNITLSGNITSSATITGGIITGGTVRAGASSGTANPRIILDATSLRALNSGGTSVTTIDVATGAFTSTSATITGNITASTLTTTGTGTIGGNLNVTGILTMGSGGLIRSGPVGTDRVEITGNSGEMTWYNEGGVAEGVIGAAFIPGFYMYGLISSIHMNDTTLGDFEDFSGGTHLQVYGDVTVTKGNQNTGQFSCGGEALLFGNFITGTGRVDVNANRTWINYTSRTGVDQAPLYVEHRGSDSWGHCIMCRTSTAGSDGPKIGFYGGNGLNKMYNIGILNNTKDFYIGEDGGDGNIGSGEGSVRFRIFDSNDSWFYARLGVDMALGNGNWDDTNFLAQTTNSADPRYDGHNPGHASAAIWQWYWGNAYWEAKNSVNSAFVGVRSSNFDTVSSERIKTNIGSALSQPDIAERLRRVRPIHYEKADHQIEPCIACNGEGGGLLPCPACFGTNDGRSHLQKYNDETGHYGFSAEQMAEHFPEVVSYDYRERLPGGEDLVPGQFYPTSIDVMGVVGLAWAYIKVLEERIEALEQSQDREAA